MFKRMLEEMYSQVIKLNLIVEQELKKNEETEEFQVIDDQQKLLPEKANGVENTWG